MTARHHTQRTPRRQARGERRIAQILAAAAEVFAERGYEGATTNAIAATAGISPGSLYQSFGSKDAITRALAERYSTELETVHAEALRDNDLAAVPIEDLVRRVLAPLVRFNREHRAFKALFARTDMPAALREATAPLQEGTLEYLTALFAARAPGLPQDELRRVAVVGMQLTKTIVPLIGSSRTEESEWYARELRRVLVTYLSDRLDE